MRSAPTTVTSPIRGFIRDYFRLQVLCLVLVIVVGACGCFGLYAAKGFCMFAAVTSLVGSALFLLLHLLCLTEARTEGGCPWPFIVCLSRINWEEYASAAVGGEEQSGLERIRQGDRVLRCSDVSTFATPQRRQRLQLQERSDGRVCHPLAGAAPRTRISKPRTTKNDPA